MSRRRVGVENVVPSTPSSRHMIPLSSKHVPIGVALAVAVGLFAWAYARWAPPAVDWVFVFRPAALTMMGGESPYAVEGYLNAPWALIPLMPLALLPVNYGQAILTVLALGSLSAVSIRLGIKPIPLAILLLSPPILHGLLNGNLDWLALLGLLIPPWLGLFLLAIKPQIGIGVALYWMARRYQESGLASALKMVAPLGVVLLITFLVFGVWPLRFERELNLWWNASLFPHSLPLAIALLATAISRDRLGPALASSPMFSPYTLLHTWVAVLIGAIGRPLLLAGLSLAMWILVLSGLWRAA